jgi:hypothetical protein
MGQPAPSTPNNQTPPSDTDKQKGALTTLWFSKGGTYDVVTKYRWTLSNKINYDDPDSLNEVPHIVLKEYEIDESTIRTQFDFYSRGIEEGITGADTSKLAPYEELFPRKATGNIYRLPYFSDINFEINTPPWQSLDTIDQVGQLAGKVGGFLFGKGAGEAIQKVLEGGAQLTTAGLAATYPKVGIMDRPKLWERHDFRTLEIKFPLFNTLKPNDWKVNRSLCWLLVNQNLYTKKSFITGLPPVYYEAIIPGQHYSFAAAVTNLVIYNRGNMRQLLDDNDQKVMVPDAYEVNITLTDMVMPSRNLFQAIQEKQQEIVVTSK